jgi:hypothetical protein
MKHCRHCRFLNVFGPCHTEHERLMIWSNLANILANLRLETHAKDTIGFVHDCICCSVLVLSVEYVNQMIRSSNDNLDASLQVTYLRAFYCRWHSTNSLYVQ